jgi:cell fate (sporulation/competence/biofilm development) regulator YmcA (YheA/YmcA/DUF963 family)
MTSNILFSTSIKRGSDIRLLYFKVQTGNFVEDFKQIQTQITIKELTVTARTNIQPVQRRSVYTTKYKQRDKHEHESLIYYCETRTT